MSQICPEQIGKDSYKVNTEIKVFDDQDGSGKTYDRMARIWDGDMTKCVDEKGLTFTSAPFFPVYENELTGIPSIDIWVTSTANDGDFLVYIEEVKADGTSKFITEGQMRASHRKSEPNEAWDAVGATYHSSMEADCKKMLELGMSKEPVNLKFALEPTSYVFGRGSRIRLTITCADMNAYQHPMYEKELPTIELYRGGDKASSISLPFVEHLDNTYNGKVTIDSYTGPASLYLLGEKMYLNYNGTWKNWKIDSRDFEYSMDCGKAVFKNAGFTFIHEGEPIKDGVAQNYKGGSKAEQPFPAEWHMLVASVPTQVRTEMLFVPKEKNLRIDLFMPENTKKPVPCIIYIHGYGGSYSLLNSQLIKLLDNGYAVAGVDLRNYPPNYAPDHIKDIKGNVRYLRANAAKLGIDPDKIGVYGASLGGNTALMLAVSGDNEDFEGDIGGNIEVSSRVQAATCGFAWSDGLYMGLDLHNEYAYDAELQADKFKHSDGPFSPSAEIFGFAGPGKGIYVLRKYIEDGKEGTNPLYDQKIAEAKMCSPLYHIKPDAPPIALYHGLGMTRVHIPNNQTYRTFEVLSRNDVRAFMFSNTQGDYGKAPEIQEAVLTFFNNYLMNKPKYTKVILKEGSDKVVVNNLGRKISAAPYMEGDKLMAPVEFLTEILGKPFETKDTKGFADVRMSAEAAGATVKWFDKWKMMTITM